MRPTSESKIVPNGVLRHKEAILLAVIVLLVATFYLLCLAPRIAGHDDAVYAVLAQSIAQGRGYRVLSAPGEPIYAGQYPPGFPLLLSTAFLVQSDVPSVLPGLALMSLVLAVASIPLGYRLVKDQLGISNHAALALTSLAYLNPLFVFFSAQAILSEMSYLFFSALTLVAVAWYKTGERDIGGRLFAAGLALAAAYYVRTVGLALIAAAVTWLLLQRHPRRAILVAFLVALLLVPWLARNVALGGGLFGGYEGNFLVRDFTRPELGAIGPLDLVPRLMGNMWGHVTDSLPSLFFPTLRGDNLLAFLNQWGLGWLPGFAGIGLAALLLAGYTVSLRRGPGLVDLYVLFYAGIILLPPWVTVRNLVPVLPFLLGYLWLGFLTLLTTIQKRLCTERRVRSVAWGVVALMLVSCLGSDRHALEAGAAYRATGQADRTDAGFYQAGDWVKQNTSPEDVILYIWPEKVYLCTGRKAVGIPKASPDAFLEALEGWGVDYVLIALAREVQAYDMGEEFYLKPAIERYPARFRSVYESEMEPQVTVFQVVP